MSALQKLSEAPKIQLCEDFGQSPLLLAHVTHDRSIIGVISLVGGFIAMAALGLPGAAIVGFAALNDLKYCASTDQGYSNDERTGEQPVASETVEGGGVIDVPAVTVDGEVKAIAAAPSMSSAAIEPRDIATDLGNNPQSALIFGTPGAGKGMNISNAIRAFRAKYPNVKIMMVDPKGDPKERGYWESQVDIFESKPILKTHPRSAAEWMLECIDDFRRMDSPKLLIWDELYATVTVLKSQHSPRAPKDEEPFPCLTDFQSFLATHLSLGPSSGVWVWGMSQSANLTDLGLTSGGLSTTRIIALVSPDNTGAIEGLYATKAITAPKGGMETIESLMQASPVGRACYDGKTKRWYPMARLENHSGFDRDNADWNNLGKTSPAPETRSPSPSKGGYSVLIQNGETGSIRIFARDLDLEAAREEARWENMANDYETAYVVANNSPEFYAANKSSAPNRSLGRNQHGGWEYYDDEPKGSLGRNQHGGWEYYDDEPKGSLGRNQHGGWEYYDDKTAIEVEAAAIVERPDGLDDYPLVATVWDYLDGKDPRSLKQISDAMKAKGKIPEDVLKSKIPNYDNYKEGIKTVLIFGVNQGYLKQISEDAYESLRKQ
ncbi:MAG: hypothetical protein ACRC62_26055 [Microcoleus sp.]